MPLLFTGWVAGTIIIVSVVLAVVMAVWKDKSGYNEIHEIMKTWRHLHMFSTYKVEKEYIDKEVARLRRIGKVKWADKVIDKVNEER
ncbi:hypothetical protein NG821_03320 [Prevotella cerevisiae]|uniref:Uncharacterized protein n=1 Tax=Segatella cerevisiae TaxID=2053716 RepID=A0ABT1BWW4_9BACT|nr:hypothetical protein [Segatella cerevisiae]MCO6024883.1 hypothetical protein [Segatella cerevisiae]